MRDTSTPASQLVQWIMLVSSLLLLGASLARQLYHPADVTRARAVLGGESAFGTMAGLMSAWVESLRDADSPGDVPIPTNLEEQLRDRFQRGELERQRQHARWLERFEAAVEIAPEYKGWLRESCGELLQTNPVDCHGRIAARLDDEVRMRTTVHERANGVGIAALVAFLISALVLLGQLLAARRRARA